MYGLGASFTELAVRNRPFLFMPDLSNANSTGGLAVNCAGSVVAYAANSLRWDCLNGRRAIVVEAGETNIIPDNTAASTAFNYEGRADWNQDTALAPDGVSQADKLCATAEDGSHYSRVRDYGTDNSPVTFSVCLKAAELDEINLGVYDTDDVSNQFRVELNLTTGEITNGIVFGNAVLLDMKSTPLIDGWTLFSITGTPNTLGAGGTIFVQLQLVKGGTASFLGDGVEGIHVWLPDLKQTAAYSSPILTTGTPASRATDIVTVPLTGDYTNGVRVRGTFRMEDDINTNFDRLFQLDDEIGNQVVVFWWSTVAMAYRLQVFSGAVLRLQYDYDGAGIGDLLDIDITFTSSGVTGSINGDEIDETPSGGFPAVATAYLGNRASGDRAPTRLLCSKFIVEGVTS
ncbi:phage head spike fiber domain-containing protein [Celeribacter sp.]|uniref:phage head spike fiber domain-containing protein n=1 Tax=Celeribacter sp. TaxID=1890673 RepID=UPI003A92725F